MSIIYFLIFPWFPHIVLFQDIYLFAFLCSQLLFFNLFQSACRSITPCFTDLVIIITVRNAMYHRGRPTSREMTVEMCSGGYLFSQRDHYLLTRKNEREGKKGLNEEQAAAANADDRKREKGGRKWDREKVKKDESERRIKNERESDEKEDGAFDLRNRSLNQIYWVIELCGGMTPQDSFFLISS